MKAADRIAYYAERFSLVEIETTYRFPPTPDVSRQWNTRTPNDFSFYIDCWSLLTGQPTMPASLWEDLVPEVRPDRRDRPKLYASHLSSDALEEAWTRFVHAVTPLSDAQKLGAIVLRFPRWFSPREESRIELERIRERLGSLPAAVELTSRDWVEAAACESTFDLLEDLGFTFVCVDAADDDPRGLNGAHAATTDLGLVRLLGRKRDDSDMWNASWRSYRYDHEELNQLAQRIGHLAEGVENVHVLVSTCWRDDAVRNAEALQEAFLNASKTINLRSAG